MVSARLLWIREVLSTPFVYALLSHPAIFEPNEELWGICDVKSYLVCVCSRWYEVELLCGAVVICFAAQKALESSPCSLFCKITLTNTPR
jgi:hypothetical protein